MQLYWRKNLKAHSCYHTGSTGRTNHKIVRLPLAYRTGPAFAEQTVELHSLRSTTTHMAEKELILGVTAYNFVRAAILVAAQAADMDPRRIGFSSARQVVDAAWEQFPQAQAARKHECIADALACQAAPQTGFICISPIRVSTRLSAPCQMG